MNVRVFLATPSFANMTSTVQIFGSFQTQNWIDFCLNSGTHLRGFIEHIFLRARHKRHQVVEEKVHVERVWGPGICIWISHCMIGDTGRH